MKRYICDEDMAWCMIANGIDMSHITVVKTLKTMIPSKIDFVEEQKITESNLITYEKK